jgi:citrate synthase
MSLVDDSTMNGSDRWLTSEQAAAALGVRRSTLYSYVSRGLVTRGFDRDSAGHRVSRFDRAEVIALAAARTRSRAGTLSVLIESDVSALDPDGRLTLRGRPIGDVVAAGSFEDTAAMVLQAGPGWPLLPPAWRHRTGVPASAGRRQADDIRAAVLAAAACDPDRGDLSARHCQMAGMLAVEAGCVAVSGLTAESGPVAVRLSGALAGSGDPVLVRCLDVALTVLIDHELTASTLAARAAAGVRADPWMAILAGQCAMSGPGQAAASQRAARLLHRWRDGIAPEPAGPLPGFGHHVYTGADPRYELLLAEVARLDASLVAEAERLCVEVARTRRGYPNVDLALAALILAAGLPPGSGEVIFTLARTIGLAAHVMEEYPHRLRLRPRALASQAAAG